MSWIQILVHLNYLGDFGWGYFFKLSFRKKPLVLAFSIFTMVQVYIYIYVWFYILAVLGLHCFLGFCSSCGTLGLCSSCARVSRCSGFSCSWALGSRACGLQTLRCEGSVVVVHRLSCSVACGIFPDQGLNSYLLHWQADSLSLSHQGRPTFFKVFFISLDDQFVPQISRSNVFLCESFIRAYVLIVYHLYYFSGPTCSSA